MSDKFINRSGLLPHEKLPPCKGCRARDLENRRTYKRLNYIMGKLLQMYSRYNYLKSKNPKCKTCDQLKNRIWKLVNINSKQKDRIDTLLQTVAELQNVINELEKSNECVLNVSESMEFNNE